MARSVEEVIIRLLGESKSAESALDRTAKRLRNFGAILTGVSDAALVTFAKLGESGAEIEALEGKFERMARAFGQSADEMLATWEEAAAGTISRAELMRKANQAALLGLPVDRLADLLQIARNAAEATGESVSYMFDSLVTGIGRQSKLVLDNLGIVFSATEAYDAYAKSIGKTAEQLTAQEKQAAFLEATLKAAARQEAILGKATGGANVEIQRAKAALQDVKDEISKAFVPVARVAAKIVTGLADAFKAIPEPVKQAGAKFAAMAAGAGAVVGPALTLKGSLPLISKALAAIGVSGGAILPVLLVVGALAGAVGLLAKAWNENWGGIQETVQRAIAIIKEGLAPIVEDLKAWGSAIKDELAGIMAAIRAIIEPALARLRELFGDGFGLREAMVFVRDAVNVILSYVHGLLSALRALLEGRSEDAWRALSDAGINAMTLIALGWKKYISKALVWGWNLVVNLANGIIRAAQTVLVAAANLVGNILGGFFAPGSPPKKGPLRGILKWGKGLIDTYLQGFALADFGILRETMAPLRQALESAVALGDLPKEQLIPTFQAVREQVAGLIADFRKTGEISEEALGAISEQLGEGGKDYVEYLRRQLEHQKALDNLKKVQAEVAEAEKKGFIPAALKKKLKAAEEEVKAKEEAVNWQKEYLAAMQEGVDLQREQMDILDKLAKAMEKIASLPGALADALSAFTPSAAPEMPEIGVKAELGGFSAEFEAMKKSIQEWLALPLEEKINRIAQKLTEMTGIDFVGFWETAKGELEKIKELGLWSYLEDALGRLVTNVKTNLPKWSAQIGQSLHDIALKALQWLTQKSVEIYVGLFTWFTNLVMGLLGYIHENYQEWGNSLADYFGMVIGTWLTWLTEDLPRLLSEVTKWFGKLVVDWLSWIVTEGPTWGSDLFASFVVSLVEWIKLLVIDLPTWKEELTGWMGDLVAQFVASVLEHGPEWLKNLVDIGRQIVNSIKQGVLDKWDGFIAWVNQQLDLIPKAIRDLLGIHSPSKVFMEIGQEMAAGLVAGFDLSAIRGNLQASMVHQLAPAPAVASAGAGSRIIVIEGGLNLPGVRDGRDAGSLIEALERMAETGSLKGLVPGGIT